MTFMVRQGDVFLQRVEPIEGEPISPDGGAIVLAYGESSGHRHQLPARGNKLFQRGSARYLEIGARSGALLRVVSDRGEPLQVERHEPVKLPPGFYKVTIQREWTLSRQIRRVVD